jgi:hypothetical protein
MAKHLKIDVFHVHEALDRCSMITLIVNDHLIEHPVIQENKELKELAEKANELLSELYQRIGAVEFNTIKK